MIYCKDAEQLLGIQVMCGGECPLVTKCPRLILEDAMDEAVRQAVNALLAVNEVNREHCTD